MGVLSLSYFQFIVLKTKYCFINACFEQNQAHVKKIFVRFFFKGNGNQPREQSTFILKLPNKAIQTPEAKASDSFLDHFPLFYEADQCGDQRTNQNAHQDHYTAIESEEGMQIGKDDALV